jgi:hypothetical protein
MKDDVRLNSTRDSLLLSDESTQPNSSGSSFIRHPSSFLRWVVLVCRFGLAALFLFTAGAKLAILKTFAGNVGELLSAVGIGQARWTWPATIAVIAAEVLTAGLLLWPRTVRLGAAFAAVLLIGFSAFALYYRYGLGNLEGLECGCFGGIIASQLGVTTALRNLALLIPTLLVFFRYRKPTQPTIPDYEQIGATT